MSTRATIIFSLIIFAGLFLRIYNFEGYLDLHTDTAAAFWIANRIIKDKIFLVGAPQNELANANIYIPTWYYFISLFYLIFKNEISIFAVFVFLGYLSIILIFLVTRELFDVKTGLIASLLYAFSHQMILYSRYIWQPYPVPFFVLLSLYILLVSRKKESRLLFILSIFFYFVSMMHITALLLLPAYFVLYSLSYKTIRPKDKYWLKTSFLFLLFFFSFYIPVFLLQYKLGFSAFRNLTNILYGQTDVFKYNLTNFYTSISTHSKLFFQSIFFSENTLFYLLFMLLFLVYLAVSLFNINAGKNKKLLILCFIFIFSIFLTGLYHGKALSCRLAALYPIFFLIFAYFIGRSLFFLKDESLVYKIFSIFITLCFFIFIKNNILAYKEILEAKKPAINYLKPFKVAQYILESAKGENFSIYTIWAGVTDNRDSMKYIYALEKITDRNYGRLNEWRNWLNAGWYNNIRWIYLICRDYQNPFIALDNCLDLFIDQKQLNLISESKIIMGDVIFRIEKPSKDTSAILMNLPGLEKQ